jgi:hypothetical protein
VPNFVNPTILSTYSLYALTKYNVKHALAKGKKLTETKKPIPTNSALNLKIIARHTIEIGIIENIVELIV